MTTEIDDLLLGLDEQQHTAVTASGSLLAVIAGAGSGKTAVLTRRVAYRTLGEVIDPRHTVVLTFTRQAAEELRRRLGTLGLRESPLAGTFHAIALSLLRQYWDDHGRRHPTVVSDRSRLLAEILGSNAPGRLADTSVDIDWIRARNIESHRLGEHADHLRRPPEELVRILADLEALKRKRGVVDLDDLLSLCLERMATDQTFAASVHWRLRHFFVDEAQDLNPLQIALLSAWRAERDDLTVVGDPAQAIYGFNGADPSVLVEPERYFPGIQVVRLDTNYRCTPEIVEAGLRVLAQAATTTPPLRSARASARHPIAVEYTDESAEALGVASFVARMRVEEWRDTAILARTNAQLPIVRAALETAGVRVTGGHAADPIQRAVREAGERSNSHELAAWSRDARDASVDDDDDVVARRQVADAVDEFLREGGRDGLGFTAWVRTNRPFRHENDGVELLTFHAAKGREWGTVVLIGAEAGLVPHRSARTRDALDEETRLAYVAVTRASDRLVVTRAATRRGRSTSPSPLLDDFPDNDVREAPSADYLAGRAARRSESADPDPTLTRLVRWRDRVARTSRVEPRLIVSDDTLKAIARARPRTVDQLAEIGGVGRPLADRVGAAILRELE